MYCSKTVGKEIMNTSLSLSFELIYLMDWLLKNEKKMLNALIKHAIKKGLAHDIKKLDSTDVNDVSEKLYDTILDFLLYFEDSLAKNLDTVQLDTKTEDAILPTLKRIDLDNLGENTVKLSMQETKSQLNDSAEEEEGTVFKNHADKVLFEQILKNWKPTTKDTLN